MWFCWMRFKFRNFIFPIACGRVKDGYTLLSWLFMHSVYMLAAAPMEAIDAICV